MSNDELVKWLLLAFIGGIQFLALSYVKSIATTVTKLTEQGNRLARIVAVMQREVEWISGKKSLREIDYLTGEHGNEVS